AHPVRIAAFMAWMVLLTIVIGVPTLPVFALPRRVAAAPATLWRRLVLWGFRHFIGVRVIVRGLERIPPGPVLIAVKHQAMWDTIKVFDLVPDPTVVMKRELLKVPFYGWYGRKLEMIGIERDAKASALRALLKDASRAIAQGRPIVIFPEGTRTQPGERIPYKPGVAALYRSLGVTCVPVALNSGLCWPARGFAFRPGTITIEVQEPIPPGLGRDRFLNDLTDQIEVASSRLADTPPMA
ncbi:MAG: lysophospholipid acyltransferase family protein, partial [Alphaproteobacteria bacterium]